MADAAPPTPAVTARRLLRGVDRAALATDMAGQPYASLVLVATAPDGAPLLLLSELAQHSTNLKANPLLSLLLDGTAGLDEPLTGPRLSLLGRAERIDEPQLLARYCARHPAARRYAGFADFHLYRIVPEKAHLVAGFGRIDWVAGAALLVAAPEVAAAEAEILAHMNEEHGAAIALYARVLLGRDGDGWRLTGLDAEGADLRRGGAVARLAFAAPVRDAAAARREFVRLAEAARADRRGG